MKFDLTTYLDGVHCRGGSRHLEKIAVKKKDFLFVETEVSNFGAVLGSTHVDINQTLSGLVRILGPRIRNSIFQPI